VEAAIRIARGQVVALMANVRHPGSRREDIVINLTRRKFAISAAAATAAFGLDRPMEFVPAAHAQKAPAPAAPPAKTASFKRFKVGDIEAITIYDGHWERQHDAAFIRNASVDETKAALKAAGLSDANVTIPFTVTIARIKGKYVMFDSGTGGQVQPTAGLMMSEGMKAAGIDPAKISTILVSHFHPDHIFGLMAKDTNAQLFPAAEIMVPEAEFKYWTDAGVFSKLPEARHGLAKRIQATFPTWKNVKVVASGAKEPVPGVTQIAAPGHTIGHTAYQIGSGNRQLIVSADTANIPALFIKNPGWHVQFDADPKQAEETRRKLFDRVVADKAIVTGYHFGVPGAGTITKDGNGYAFKAMA
jgi:glyoxylase-like metal-dependent hydrolase (beta-lactamase superfamily II)